MPEEFLTICLNPVIQKTILLPQLVENQVNRSNQYFTDASGKGVNVTRVLTQLGENAIHLTQLGGRFREYFLELANQDQLQIRWAESFSEIRSCYTLINQARNTSTEIVEEARAIAAGTESRVWALFQDLLPHCSMIIISGTKAAGFSDKIFPEMVEAAKKQGKLVLVDYRGKDLLNSIQFRPDFIKPNFQEFVTTFFPEVTGQVTSTVESTTAKVKAKMEQLYHDFGIISILTRGSQEILYVNAGAVQSISPPKITPVNTIGCGDAFAAGFAASWCHEETLLPALHKGLECAQRNARLIRPGVIK